MDGPAQQAVQSARVGEYVARNKHFKKDHASSILLRSQVKWDSLDKGLLDLATCKELVTLIN